MSNVEILWAAGSDSTNIVFSIIIFTIAVIGILLSIARKAERLRDYLPSFSVSIGIFGTFWGIFLGLSGFDTTNISDSIPALLNGMKTAFYTSLLGMAVSLVLKLFYSIQEDRTAKGSTDPMVCLQNMEHSSIEIAERIEKLNDTIGRCFRSDEEYSLVSQVKLIRQELIDGRRETKDAFKDFADQFSKMASESLVEELKGVVDKFNAMLNDLVSQSFHDLKESTIRLNTWQADYKETINKNHENLTAVLGEITSLTKLFGESVHRVNTLSHAFDSIDSNLKSISVSGNELSAHSTRLSEQNLLLQASINEIKRAGEHASIVVPEISKKMNEIVDQIHGLQTASTEFVRTTTKELQSHAKELSETSQTQIAAIEKSLEEELRRSLESFAGVMVALSTKFASDYTPLTDRLREIVKIAQRVDHV